MKRMTRKMTKKILVPISFLSTDGRGDGMIRDYGNQEGEWRGWRRGRELPAVGSHPSLRREKSKMIRIEIAQGNAPMAYGG